MRSLVTGITGFVGNHLARHLLKDSEVFGMKRWRSRTDQIDDIKDSINLIECDLTDPWAVRKALKAVQPDEIYHLAAQSYVDASFVNPVQTLESNIIGTANLFEAIVEVCPRARIHFASSSEVYGQVRKDETPIKEGNHLRPASPYAVSKAACDLLVQNYITTYGLNVVITRSFTHTGPGRGEVFVESSFAKQIAKIEKGIKNALWHGNLNSVRTWLDVRDIVRLFVLANRGCPSGVYVVGGDTVKTVEEMLEFLKSISTAKIVSKVDQARIRPSDVTLQIPDSSRIREATGWKPEIPFETTMTDLLNYWRSKI